MNGTCYEGTWVDGLQSGYGAEVQTDGDFYEGTWKLGLKSGNGTKIWINGNKYEGQWANGTFLFNIISRQERRLWSRNVCKSR